MTSLHTEIGITGIIEALPVLKIIDKRVAISALEILFIRNTLKAGEGIPEHDVHYVTNKYHINTISKCAMSFSQCSTLQLSII